MTWYIRDFLTSNYFLIKKIIIICVISISHTTALYLLVRQIVVMILIVRISAKNLIVLPFNCPKHFSEFPRILNYIFVKL